MILADRDMKGNFADEMSHPYAGLLLAYGNKIKTQPQLSSLGEYRWGTMDRGGGGGGGVKQERDGCDREINRKWDTLWQTGNEICFSSKGMEFIFSWLESETQHREGYFLESRVSKVFLLRKSVSRLQFFCPIFKFTNIIKWDVKILRHVSFQLLILNNTKTPAVRTCEVGAKLKDIILYLMWGVFSYGTGH